MRVRFSGFTPIELILTVGIIAAILSLGIGTTARVRELSKRSVCSLNLAGIGASAKIYAADNNGKWMIPAFREAFIETGIIYTRWDNGIGPPGQTGYEREFESRSATPTFPAGGSTEVAVTRAFWMLVRSGDVSVKQFICPSSGDVPDPTENIDFYYDFTEYENISYGYQVPFGPLDTQPREGMDHRQAVAADKGPWYLELNQPNWLLDPRTGDAIGIVTLYHAPKAWRPYNSPNHGGNGQGEGQNILFGNGGVSFLRKPAVGVDDDNIYTVMTDDWNILGFNRIHGEAPTEWADPPYPGRDALGAGDGKYSSTDSLIYP
jgi:hypothetical protein